MKKDNIEYFTHKFRELPHSFFSYSINMNLQTKFVNVYKK